MYHRIKITGTTEAMPHIDKNISWFLECEKWYPNLSWQKMNFFSDENMHITKVFCEQSEVFQKRVYIKTPFANFSAYVYPLH